LSSEPTSPGIADDAVGQGRDVEVRQLQSQVQRMREQYETTLEELRAANEELQSANEEYKSTLEELETSKEELQSTNEELQTVNQEYKTKIEEVSQAHGDLQNLFAATDIATLFLDRALRIQRYTPAMIELFHLQPTDRGRPLAHLRGTLHYEALAADARQVLKALTPVERELQGPGGSWFLMRMRPYRTVDDRIDGVVLTFVDITANKTNELALQAAKEYAESIVYTIPDALLVLQPDLRIQTANDAFYTIFQVRPEQTEGELIYELGNAQWDIPALRTLLEEILPHNNVFTDYEVTHDFADIGRRTMLLNGRRLDHVQLILLAITDITERKQAEEALAEQARLLNLSNDGIIVRDVDNRIIYWNQGATELYGWTRDEAIGQDLHTLLRTEFEAPFEQLIQRLHQVDRLEGEVVQVTRDDRRRTLLCRWALDRDQAGQPGAILTTYNDITERKQAEAALQQLTETLEQRVAERTEALRTSEAQLRVLASELTMAEQAERRRIAQILHDDLQQRLFGTRMLLKIVAEETEGTQSELAAYAEQAYGLLGDAIALARQLTVDLSPPVLKEEGLADMLQWLATQLARQHALQVEVRAKHRFVIPEADMRVLLFQCVRELLFNVVKHGQTDHATVELAPGEAGYLRIQVSDAGRGFDVAAAEARHTGGFGLFSVRERLGFFGGRMAIDSAPGQGTRITLEVPAAAIEERDR
jgi:PAS domain S-box-containing protein